MVLRISRESQHKIDELTKLLESYGVQWEYKSQIEAVDITRIGGARESIIQIRIDMVMFMDGVEVVQ